MERFLDLYYAKQMVLTLQALLRPLLLCQTHLTCDLAGSRPAENIWKVESRGSVSSEENSTQQDGF